MYAVINDRGRQYQASPGIQLTIDRREGEPGSTFELPVQILSDGGTVRVGAPYVAGTKAVCKVLDHTLGEKIVIGKFKRRKRNMRRQGFRHSHTVVQVVSIG
jgi:large subunit ribosomal protein L21